MSRALLLLLMIVALPALAADDARTSFLEQEVRNLQRQLQVLTRQVEEIRNTPSRVLPRAGEARAATPAPDSPRWVNAARWREIEAGMSELEVIGALGPPTSVRVENDVRILLYAIELGASGVLGGNIRMRDRVVVAVNKPILQ